MIVWIVLVIALFLFYKLVLSPSEPDVEELEPIVFQTFTPKGLSKFNGKDDPRVLIGIKGKVFDVSAAKNYYGPGGMYENFAGRDASRGLAKHSFEADMLTSLEEPIDDLADLVEEERAALDQWFDFFGGKYPHCGDLIDP